MKKLLLVLCSLLAAATVSAADGKLMHCFYFTPVNGASQADWDAFYKATGELPSKIPGLIAVWAGKLSRPMAQIRADRAAMEKLRAGEKEAPGTVQMSSREYGVCMEMRDEAALKAYAGHPAHKEWEAVYGKVRQSGTMTFDILVK
jgi:hypothetical protein